MVLPRCYRRPCCWRLYFLSCSSTSSFPLSPSSLDSLELGSARHCVATRCRLVGRRPCRRRRHIVLGRGTFGYILMLVQLTIHGKMINAGFFRSSFFCSSRYKLALSIGT
ncbi:uncharacterized protein LOC110266344 isoform X2 [Arachis ipaensis]|uniref:uncharacterized protein LOC110266344 isoform X2 n=1 Tax=Arachis ipaensis TaxID=130454 RepID=UPI000A2B35BA|nr:uncharacterized protein LOC110266344 isoform X2 [Arachis ipaensis]